MLSDEEIIFFFSFLAECQEVSRISGYGDRRENVSELSHGENMSKIILFIYNTEAH